jgi:hypothetical protein
MDEVNTPNTGTRTNVGSQLENVGISALAAASKTPFRTAFMVTLGIGLGRLVLFSLGLSGLGLAAYVTMKLLQ